MLAATSAALAMVETRAAHAGCTKDVECKGLRICENGRCVDPPPEAGIESPSAAASAGAVSDVAAPVPPAAAVATPATAAPPGAVSPAASSASVTSPPSPASAATKTEVAASGKGEFGGPGRVAPRAVGIRRPCQRFLVEVGGFGFGSHDGKAGAFGGGVETGYRLLRWLAIGAWLEGSGKSEQATQDGPAAYRLYDLGLGLTVGGTVGTVLADLSVLPELTLLSIEARNLVPGTSVTRWGAAASERLRVGLRLGPWCPFIFVAGSYAFRAERFTVYDQHVYSGDTTLPRGHTSLGLGLAYLFGVASAASSNGTIVRWPSPSFDE